METADKTQIRRLRSASTSCFQPLFVSSGLASVEPLDGFALLLDCFTKVLHCRLILLRLASAKRRSERRQEDKSIKPEHEGRETCGTICPHLEAQLFYLSLLFVDLTDKLLLLLQQVVHRLPQLWWTRRSVSVNRFNVQVVQCVTSERCRSTGSSC